MAHTLKKNQKQKDAMRAMTSIPTEDYDLFRKLEKHYKGLITMLDDLDAEADAAICRTADVVFITVAGSSIHRKILKLLKPKISELIIFFQERNQIIEFSNFQVFFRRSCSSSRCTSDWRAAEKPKAADTQRYFSLSPLKHLLFSRSFR